jgi:L-iditol 2-dehydrogenase
MDRDQIEAIVREVITGVTGGHQVPIARAAVLTAKETLIVREFPLRPIRSDEILIKVEGCGICGTDIHCYKNDPFNLCPVVLGHEGTGEVVEVGADWKIDSVGKPIRVGDKVVTSLMETSDSCMIAKYNPLKANLCDDIRIYGLLPDEPDNHLNGYFGEYVIVRPGSSIFVINDMSLKLRVLIEPATVVCHALERAKKCGVNLNFRSRVIVQGCGPIGLLMVAVLRTYGVNNIIAIDGDNSRLAMAQRLGADHAINYKDYQNSNGVAARVGELTKGFGAHFAFQVTGVPQAASALFRYVRRGGAICEVGHFVDAGTATFNPHEDICKKEITYLGSWAYGSWEYPNAYHFLQRAAHIGLPVEELVTHHYPLSRIDEAFRANIRQEGIKLMVTPD